MTEIAEIEQSPASTVGLPGVEFDGLTTHRGIWYLRPARPRGRRPRRGPARRHADKLRSAGSRSGEFTAGGLVYRWQAGVPGVTRRAGTYVFYDLMHLGSGTATEDQLALSALCTVVSRRTPDRLTIDGGSKTFSGDRGVVGGTKMHAPDVARAVDRPRLCRHAHRGASAWPGPTSRSSLARRSASTRSTPARQYELTNEIVGVRGGRVETVWTVAARGCEPDERDVDPPDLAAACTASCCTRCGATAV